MIVNPDVDVYTKTEFTGKHYEKRKKNINTRIKLSRGPIFTFSLPGDAVRPLLPLSVTPLLRVT